MTFLKRLWNFLVGLKNVVVTLLVLGLLALLLRYAFHTESAQVPNGSVLRVALDGFVVEQRTAVSPREALTSSNGLPNEILLADLLLALDHAAKDSRIKAATLELDNFAGAGPATLESVGEALEAFKRSGKPVIAHGIEFSDKQYYLAAHANEIQLDPMGSVMLQGYGTYQLYLKNAIDRLKINVNVFRVGKYKSFVEPYTRTDMSPEAREADKALLDTLWETYTQEVETAREKGFKVMPYINTLASGVSALQGNTAQYALDHKAVDKLADEATFVSYMQKRYGPGEDQDELESFAQVSINNYITATKAVLTTSGDAISVVYAVGEIVDGEHGSGTAGGDSVSRLIHQAINDSSTKAIVLRVDSPGGSVFASEKIRRALLDAKAKKIPVIASMGSVAASGGYWISTAADEILAEPATITGSIGIFAIIPTFENTLGIAGVKSDGVGTTKFSASDDITQAFSPDIKTFIQSTTENGYGQFLSRVAEARHMSVAQVNEIAQGRVWAGSTAHQLKLIDRFGGLDEALRTAARRAGLKSWHMNVIQQSESLPSQLLKMVTSRGESRSTAPSARGLAGIAAADQLSRAALLLTGQSLTDRNGLYAWCLECSVLAPTHQFVAKTSDKVALLRMLANTQ